MELRLCLVVQVGTEIRVSDVGCPFRGMVAGQGTGISYWAARNTAEEGLSARTMAGAGMTQSSALRNPAVLVVDGS